MKLFSSVLAAATIACAAYALLNPAAAQQNTTPAQTEEDEQPARSGATKQRGYASGNYQLELPVTKEGLVDSVTVKQSTATDSVGDVRDYAVEPAAQGDRVADTPRTDGPTFGAPASSMPRIVAPGLRAPVLTVPQIDPVKQDSDDDDEDDQD